jgi:hypothetical protein
VKTTGICGPDLENHRRVQLLASNAWAKAVGPATAAVQVDEQPLSAAPMLHRASAVLPVSWGTRAESFWTSTYAW